MIVSTRIRAFIAQTVPISDNQKHQNTLTTFKCVQSLLELWEVMEGIQKRREVLDERLQKLSPCSHGSMQRTRDMNSTLEQRKL